MYFTMNCSLTYDQRLNVNSLHSLSHLIFPDSVPAAHQDDASGGQGHVFPAFLGYDIESACVPSRSENKASLVIQASCIAI